MMSWTNTKLTAIAGIVAAGTVLIKSTALDPAPGAAKERDATKAVSAGWDDARLKAEWRGKRAVQLSPEGDVPVWSPDGSRVAFRYVNTARVGQQRVLHVEAGVGVVNLATGQTAKTALVNDDAHQFVHFCAWRTDGKSLLAAAGDQVWSVTPIDDTLKAEMLFRMPAKTHLDLVSPDDQFLACFTGMDGILRRQGDFLVFDAAGTRLAAGKGAMPMWSPDGKSLYYGHDEELRVMSLPEGKEETLFRADDYFRGQRPETQKGILWALRPVRQIAVDTMIVEVVEEHPLSLKKRPYGKVVTAGQIFLWKRTGPKHEFTKIGDTRYGLHGTDRYLPLGKEGMLLRSVTPARQAQAHQATPAWQMVNAVTGDTKDLAPSEELENVSFYAADAAGSTLLFTAWPAPRGTPPATTPRAHLRLMGLAALDTAAAQFRFIDLPVTVNPGDDLRQAHEQHLVRSGKDGISVSLLLAARLKADPDDDWKPNLGGIWLINLNGQGTVLLPEDPDAIRQAHEAAVAAAREFIFKYMADARKNPEQYRDFTVLNNKADMIERLGDKAEADRLREQIDQSKKQVEAILSQKETRKPLRRPGSERKD